MVSLIRLLKYNCFSIYHYNNIIQLDCRQGLVVYAISLTDGLYRHHRLYRLRNGYVVYTIYAGTAVIGGRAVGRYLEVGGSGGMSPREFYIV